MTFLKKPMWVVCSALALCSCAKMGKDANKGAPGPSGTSALQAQLRAQSSVDGGTPIIAGGNTSPELPMIAGFTPDEDIVYTDPDNPDAIIPELADVLTAPTRGPWEASETIARRRSVREGKPLLIWFTDSQSSPMCKAVSQELFSKSDFGAWATEKLVRLRVDANIIADDPALNLDEKETRKIDIRTYNNELRKRYKVLGYPTFVMLNSSGEVVGRYRGYKRGDADFFWGQLKHGQIVADNANKSWRANLSKKGYREWSDRKGRVIFARLDHYSKGTLTFIEPDGTRSRTTEEKLSDGDRIWIAEQKKLRNM
jgi:thioredoxin-related protein